MVGRPHRLRQTKSIAPEGRAGILSLLSKKRSAPRIDALVAALKESRFSHVGHDDIQRLTGLSESASRQLAARMVERGALLPVARGIYEVIGVPGQPRHEPTLANHIYWHVVGQAHYLSHGSAMAAHGLAMPPSTLIVTTAASLKPRRLAGAAVHFRCRPPELHVPATWMRVDGIGTIAVSDPIPTLLDGLKSSRYCGGVIHAARFLAHFRGRWDVAKLVDAALQLDAGSVIRRLGFLLELAEIGDGREWARLRKRLTPAYALLDSTAAPGGRYLERWRVQVNVPVAKLDEALHIVPATPTAG